MYICIFIQLFASFSYIYVYQFYFSVKMLYRFLCTLCVWGVGCCVWGCVRWGCECLCIWRLSDDKGVCIMCVCDGCEGVCIFWQKLLVLACLDVAWCCGVECSKCCWWGTGRLWVLRLFGEFVWVMSFWGLSRIISFNSNVCIHFFICILFHFSIYIFIIYYFVFLL